MENQAFVCFNMLARAAESDAFRRDVDSSPSMEVTLMTLLPGERTAEEVHAAREQTFFVVSGTARFTLADAHDGATLAAARDATRVEATAGYYARVRRGTRHQLECPPEAREPLRLFTHYSTRNHEPGVLHKREADARAEPDYDVAHSVATSVLRKR